MSISRRSAKGVSFEKAPFITSESSESEVFCTVMLGYSACSKSKRLVSDLLPVMAIEDDGRMTDFCSSNFTLFELIVVVMPVVIALGLQFHFLIESSLKIDSRLIGQAQYHKNNIG